MDKRTVLAIGLSILVLLIFQYFYAPTPVIQTDNQTQTETTSNELDQKLSAGQASESADVKRLDSSKDDGKSQVKTFDITTNNLKITFNSETGNIYTATVLQYKDKEFPDLIFKSEDGDYLNVLSASVTGYEHTVKEFDNRYEVQFVGETKDVVISKIYIIKKDSYFFDLKVTISNISDQTIQTSLGVIIGPGLGKGFEDSKYMFSGPLIFNGKKVTKEDPEDVKEPINVDKPHWLGYTSKYFLFSVMNGGLAKSSIESIGNSKAVVKGSKDVIVNPLDKNVTTFPIFVGPKEYDLLSSNEYELEKSIEFGIFSFLSIPMLQVLNFTYDYVGNYGLAIIVLTFIIKILTYPLTQKSMTSMKKMQVLQPEMVKIREKFKGEPQKMNAAMMDLYKKHGANPMGGCLPMVIQIPIFIALYKTLLVSIELKGSPFVFWIADLSQKDPYFITPVLMGVTMFLQQRMTPTTGDPTQQKIFMFLPLVFTFIFLNFPAGLVIYWLTNNVLTIIQQYFINKKLA